MKMEMENNGQGTLSITNENGSQRRGMHHNSKTDHISQLPLDILLQIVWFLPYKYWVVMSIVSKHFKNVWTYAPILHFDEKAMAEAPKIRFIRFVDRTIRFHSGFTIKVLNLSINYYQHFWDVSTIDGWVSLALTRNIKELELNFDETDSFNYYESEGLRVRRISPSSLYRLPYQPFASKIMTSMTLSYCQFKASNLGTFESLMSLNLKVVDLQDNNISDLLSKFPVLESLFLERCSSGKKFYVSKEVLRIKILDIIDCFRTQWLVFPVDITAPHLLTFNFEGVYLQNFSIRKANQLTTMQIDINFPTADRFQGNFLASLLNNLDHCACLDLTTWCIQVLSTMESSPWEYLLQLRNIIDLKLCIHVIKEELPGICCLLRSCQKLETLTIDGYMVDEPEDESVEWVGFNPNVFNFEENRFWELQYLPFDCLQHSLKTIHIYGFSGRPTEVEILKFLLQKGKVLETLYIHWPDSEEEWVAYITNVYTSRIANAIRFASDRVCVVIR